MTSVCFRGSGSGGGSASSRTGASACTGSSCSPCWGREKRPASRITRRSFDLGPDCPAPALSVPEKSDRTPPGNRLSAVSAGQERHLLPPRVALGIAPQRGSAAFEPLRRGRRLMLGPEPRLPVANQLAQLREQLFRRRSAAPAPRSVSAARALAVPRP